MLVQIVCSAGTGDVNSSIPLPYRTDRQASNPKPFRLLLTKGQRALAYLKSVDHGIDLVLVKQQLSQQRPNQATDLVKETPP